MNRLKAILRLTAQIKKQSVSMQRKLLLYWLSMLVGLLAVLVLILSLAGVFSNQSQKVHESLQVQLNNAELQITRHMETLEAQSISLSEQISRELDNTLTANGLCVADLNDNPDLLQTLQRTLLEYVNTTMLVSRCSGAYLVLDATTNTQSEKASHSATGIYLRFANFNAQSATGQDVAYYRGIPDIARLKGYELHNRWNLEFDTDLFPSYNTWMQTEVNRLADACRWTKRFQLPDTWEDVMLLCVPILDSSGNVCGICGVELSSLYCYMMYPEQDSPFGPLITVLAPMQGKQLLLSNGITGGIDGTYLGDADTLEVRREHYFNTYTCGTGKYIGLHCQTSGTGADGSPLVTAVLLPESTYHAYCNSNRVILVAGSLALLVLALALTFFLSRRFVQPILQTIQAIQTEELPAKGDTGISELDELMAFVSSKSNTRALQQTGGLPPNIEELFNNFAQRAKTLTTAERGILKYYIDGHEITEIPDLAFVSIHTVKKHNSNIYQKLGISSRDELMLYLEMFRRLDRLNELTDVL